MDAAYIDALTAKVESLSACSQLQEISDQVMGDIQDQINQLQPLIDHYNALLALRTLPTNPSEIIPYLQKVSDTLVLPQLAAALKLANQGIALVQAVEQLQAAIVAKAHNFTDCTVTINPPHFP